MDGRDRRHRGAVPRGGIEGYGDRRLILDQLPLAVEALHETPSWRELPCDFSEDLVRGHAPRKARHRPRLAVCVAEVLVSTEEPHPIANGWSANRGGRVVIGRALVAALRSGARNPHSNRLAGQPRRLSEERSVQLQPIAALLQDDIDHGALDVAELR